MIDGDAVSVVPLELASRRVRQAAWVAITPLAFLVAWAVLFGFLRPIPAAPAGAEERWTAELTPWVVAGGLSIPFPAGLALVALGPFVSAAGGLVLLRRLRRDPTRVPVACNLAAALSILALATSPWVSLSYAWEQRMAQGMQSASVNLSPSLLCGGWHLFVAAWLAFAAIRYAPAFREASGPDA